MTFIYLNFCLVKPNILYVYDYASYLTNVMIVLFLFNVIIIKVKITLQFFFYLAMNRNQKKIFSQVMSKTEIAHKMSVRFLD